jgi:Tfp pilus assembly protein PilF
VRVAAALTLALGLAGVCGAWPLLGATVLGLALLIVPGFTFAALLRDVGHGRGPACLALALTTSTGILNVAFLVCLAMGGELTRAVQLSASSFVVIGAWALVVSRYPRLRPRRALLEWSVYLVAVLVVLPTVLRYAGGGVDDWWDLAYVRAIAERGALDFGEPMLGSGAVHPRFSWSVWLALQALVTSTTGGDPIDFQVAVLAPLVCVACVSAVSGLAHVVFGDRARIASAIAVVVTPAWLYATEAMPFFTRLHQDKLAAALVFVPVLLATALDYVRRPTVSRLVLFSVCATATCAVHTLVFGIGLIGVALCGGIGFATGNAAREVEGGREASFETRHVVALTIVVAAVLIFPAWQALTLRGWFAGQGVGLAFPDNPVVRAHLALDRLLAAGTPYMVVNPAAVFGPVGLWVAIGACAALRRRRPGDAYVAALGIVPAFLVFMPFVAVAVGQAIVPWMLYRVGWLIPQALLIARAFPDWDSGRGRMAARVGWTLAMAAFVVVSTVPTALDRLRRGMREHPSATEMRPRGTTLDVYRFLADSRDRRTVLAPVGFSNLVPALTGRPVVALSERGTLVFAGDEVRAYRRLRDQSDFLACATSADRRAEIARDYGVGHAVFRRRYVTSGDETAWLERATAEGVLLAADPSIPSECAADVDALLGSLPPHWRIVWRNDDYFVVETDVHTERGDSADTLHADGGWRDAFEVHDVGIPGDRAFLASATGHPAAYVRLSPVPMGYGIGTELVWVSGGSVWDDGPFEISIDLRWESACHVTGVEVVPYLETRRREVFEIVIDGEARQYVARHGVPIFVSLKAQRRPEVRVHVRSMLGLTFGLADVRVVGDRARCEGSWRPLDRPRIAEHERPIRDYLGLAAAYPNVPRLVGGAARLRAAQDSIDDAISLYRRALARQGRQVIPWVEMGLLLDTQGRFEDARTAYRRAIDVDSNSAWARGCLAWSLVRSNDPLPALYHAWRALRLDARYADAVTISALAIERLGLATVSARVLERSIEMQPLRAWPYFERARQLAAAKRYEEASALVRRYREVAPYDTSAMDLLRSLSGSATGEGGV